MKGKEKQRAVYMTDEDYEIAKKNAKNCNLSYNRYMNELNRQFELNGKINLKIKDN